MEEALRSEIRPKLENIIGECLNLSINLDTNIKQSREGPERIYMQQTKTYVDGQMEKLIRIRASIDQILALFDEEKNQL